MKGLNNLTKKPISGGIKGLGGSGGIKGLAAHQPNKGLNNNLKNIQKFSVKKDDEKCKTT